MSKIIPFKALLPNPKYVASIICPPYDVLTSSEARALAKGNPYSYLHITKAEIDLPESVDQYDKAVYDKALANLQMFQEMGYLVRDELNFYIYRQITGDHSQTGIVCGASVDEYENGKIKQHEKVREEKVVDRTRHADVIGAHSEPVFFVHKKNEAINKLVAEETSKKPLYDVTDAANVRHIFWRTNRIAEIQKLFGALDALYIADGHHRSFASSKVRKLRRERGDNRDSCNYFPVVIFPEDEVRVYQYDWSGDPAKRPLSKYQMPDIIACADRGEIMPPKSTWFSPKLSSGFFVYTL